MAKIERKYLAHFINTATGDAPVYERLGKDLEEFTPEMQAKVETKKNILGETDILISGYEKTGNVEPFYAEADSPLFEKLQDIVDQQLTLDSLKTDVVEVKLWKQAGEGAYEAYREQAYIPVNSYGGDTSGYQIPFTLHFTGKREKGIFRLDDRTFTAQ